MYKIRIALVYQLLIGSFFNQKELIASTNSQLDSLKKTILNERNDSLRQVQRIKIVQQYKYEKQITVSILNEALSEAHVENNIFWQGEINHYLGIMYAYGGEIDSAKSRFQHSLVLRKKNNDTLGIASSYQALSNIFKTTGEYDLAINHALMALRIFEYQEDKDGLARVYNNLGLIFRKIGDKTKSIHYFKKGLESAKESGNLRLQMGLLENIGGVYQDHKQYEIALAYHQKAMDIRISGNLTADLGQSYGNLGLVYFRTEQLDSAEHYLFKALEVFQSTNYKDGIVEAHIAIGEMESVRKNYLNAIQNFKKAEKLAIESRFLPMLVDIYHGLGVAYQQTKQYKFSTEYFSNYIQLKDSIFSLEKSSEVQKKEIAHQFERKALSDSLKRVEQEKLKELEQRKEQQVLDERLARQNQMILSGSLLFLATIGFSFLLWKKIKQQRKLNNIISEQNAKAELRNKEITDSINYAKRIQEATFPHPQVLSGFFENSYVIYKPKDIVAGDFYWINSINDQILVAVADCTGHGVPGALVSVICSNALNRVVKEFQILEPGKILDKTREIVIATFDNGLHDVKDGMDISLCLIDQKTKKIKWSGAHNPLWILRKKGFGYNESVEEFQANRQPVGKFEPIQPFLTHEINFKKGDRIYLFTDGLSDQFGGPNGKKFKSNRLKEVLVKTGSREMRSSRSDILNAFENWKGSFEQIDDICFIGIEL